MAHKYARYTSDIWLKNHNGKRILILTGLALAKAEGNVPLPSHDKANPFSRIVRQPDFDLLTDSQLARVYPPISQCIHTAELPKLEQLALCQLLQFHAKYHTVFTSSSYAPHLLHFTRWIAEKINLAKENRIPGGAQALAYTIPERDCEIGRLSTALERTQGPEVRLMCHMYKSLPYIYRGEMTGIQAAVQNRYLENLYGQMASYHRGNAALRDLVVLLSHKNPSLKIIEVGGGSGSATREILSALRGDTIYRGYDSYVYTDVGRAFLASAQENFKHYKGVEYAFFDIEKSVEEQGFETDFDLVIASNVRSSCHEYIVSLTISCFRYFMRQQTS